MGGGTIFHKRLFFENNVLLFPCCFLEIKILVGGQGSRVILSFSKYLVLLNSIKCILALFPIVGGALGRVSGSRVEQCLFQNILCS